MQSKLIEITDPDILEGKVIVPFKVRVRLFFKRVYDFILLR